MVELMVVLVIIAILSVLTLNIASKWTRKAKRVESLSNIRTYTAADTMYYGDHGKLPMMDGIIPSTITRARLEIVANYCNLQLPAGDVGGWPKRRDQPRWINDPVARDSGFAEGRTLGGGVYTGYVYVGGIEQSPLILSGMATVVHPERNADLRNTRRGVIWAGILAEFKTSDPRRYECFHYNTLTAYQDFRFHERELEGIPIGWSDGSAEWLSARQIKFGPNGRNLQIQHVMGNYYY
jgi:type II secretory pathway pseudopilin PulG